MGKRMKTVNEMAIEAWGAGHEIFWFDDDGIERFAALVAAAERERVMSEPINKAHCQKFESEIRADERDRAMRENAYVLAERDAILELVDSYAKNNTDLADAIRARGQA